jgi:flagellar basal-body rod protein FlgF
VIRRTRSPVGKLKLVKANGSEVVRGDDGLFPSDPGASHRGQTLQPDPNIRVMSGVLEGSNVKPVAAMADMIASAPL